MAWAGVAIAGTLGSSASNSTSIVVTLNTQVGVGANAGDVLVGLFGTHNTSSVSNADEGKVTAVADSNSNTWIKAREITNGNAATTVGTVISVWYARTDAALTTANTVTATLGSSASNDSKGGIVYRFTNSGGVRVLDSTYLVASTSTLGTMDIVTANAEYLRIRAFSARTTLTAMTTTASWVTMGNARGSAATPTESVFGEYRIVTASSAGSAPALSAAAVHASVYVVLEENQLMGDGTF